MHRRQQLQSKGKSQDFHFAPFQILHRKLCARNVFLCGTNGRAVKVGGFGIADFAPPNEEIDVTRWTAQESLRSQSQLHYASKCDVWSFGCTMWEIATLGKKDFHSLET